MSHESRVCRQACAAPATSAAAAVHALSLSSSRALDSCARVCAEKWGHDSLLKHHHRRRRRHHHQRDDHHDHNCHHLCATSTPNRHVRQQQGTARAATRRPATIITPFQYFKRQFQFRRCSTCCCSCCTSSRWSVLSAGPCACSSSATCCFAAAAASRAAAASCTVSGLESKARAVR
jgi:hypothetical protein